MFAKIICFFMKSQDKKAMGERAREYYEKFFERKQFMDKLESELIR